MAGATASLIHLQYARPISDVAAGGWLPSTGIDLYPMIDEPSPASDSDYIYSTTTPDDETAIVDVTALTDTPGAGTTTLRIRAKKT